MKATFDMHSTKLKWELQTLRPLILSGAKYLLGGAEGPQISLSITGAKGAQQIAESDPKCCQSQANQNIHCIWKLLGLIE